MENIRDEMFIYMKKNIQDCIFVKGMGRQISFNDYAHRIVSTFFLHLRQSINNSTPRQNFFLK